MPYPRRLVIATGNRHKGAEMAEILAETGLEVLTLSDFPGACADVEETGATYAENAALKARAAVPVTGLVCIADDAGLEIDALDGRPGLYSKRFLGEETPFPAKMEAILRMLEGVPEERRGCRFRCAVAIATPDGRLYECEGVCEGRIGHTPRGEFGFGYDPIFYVPSRDRHMAELPPQEKRLISHRGIALDCASRILAQIMAAPS